MLSLLFFLCRDPFRIFRFRRITIEWPDLNFSKQLQHLVVILVFRVFIVCFPRQKKLDQSLAYQQFSTNVDEEESWINEKNTLVASDDYGDTLAAAQVNIVYILSFFCLFVYYCLLFMVYRLWFIVYGLLFVVYCLWFTVCGLLFMVYCLWFTVYGLLFMVYCLWFTVFGLLFMVYSLLFCFIKKLILPYKAFQ